MSRLREMVRRIIKEEIQTSSPDNDVYVIYFDRKNAEMGDAKKFKENSPYKSTSEPRNSSYGIRITVDKQDVKNSKELYDLARQFHGAVHE